jgi:hypothetical protein
MRRRLVIKKRIQRQRLMALRMIAKQRTNAGKSGYHNFYLMSAGLTDPLFA